jgi:RNA polymerase sigma factor (TIGR02999 family)
MRQTDSKQDVTQLLIDWKNGEQAALEKLIPLVYEELRKIARNYLRYKSKDQTLQTTVLVHEAYLKLIEQNRVDWQNRLHFFGIAAHIMRRVVIDYARRNSRLKRGGEVVKISLEEEKIDVSDERSPVLLSLDEALERLAALDPQKARLVELRYFGGLSIEETAQVLEVSTATVTRQWRAVKAWLHKEIASSAGE